MPFLPLFLIIAGFIIGHGAVIVIDIHGFFGRKSAYWTEATTRTHKVTKPLIWIGTLLLLVGVCLMYRGNLLVVQLVILGLMIANGVFLSFYVSPFLLKREKEGKARELLPKKLQHRIAASFMISFVSWWGSVVLFVLMISYYASL